MNRWLGALAYMLAAGALSFAGMELARHAQQRYATDAELRVRAVLAEAQHRRAMDRQVRRDLPYMLFAVYEALEGAGSGSD